MKLIDLLNLVYEKKAPKKILYKYCKYEFDEVARDYLNKDGLYLFAYLFDNESQALYLEVEILEDKPKKIEKIKMNGDEFYSEYIDGWIEKNKYDAYCEYLSNKTNELIDQVNYLLEKENK